MKRAQILHPLGFLGSTLRTLDGCGDQVKSRVKIPRHSGQMRSGFCAELADGSMVTSISVQTLPFRYQSSRVGILHFWSRFGSLLVLLGHCIRNDSENDHWIRTSKIEARTSAFL